MMDNSPECDDNRELLATSGTGLFHRRWYILIVFSLMGVIQNVVWNTWGPISESAHEVFGWSDGTIALLSNWGPITYIIATPVSTWMLHEKGLRFSTLCNMLLVVLGTGFRCVPVETVATWFIHIGHILNGLAGPVAYAGATQLSAAWFPVGQRIVATAVIASSNGLGVALSFVLGPTLVSAPASNSTSNVTVMQPHEMTMVALSNTSDTLQIKHEIYRLMYIEFAIAAAIFLMLLLYFPSLPPCPPSISQAVTHRLDYLDSLRKLLKMPMFWLLGMTFSLSGGVYGTWTSVLDINLKSRNIPQSVAGWLGFFPAVIGNCTCVIFSLFAAVFRRHLKIYIILLYTVCTSSFLVFTLAYVGYFALSQSLMYTTLIVTAMFLQAATPLFFELCCETAYPVSEGVTNGILTCLYNISGLLFLLVLFIPDIGSVWMNYCLVSCFCLCLPFLIITKPRYSRLDVDTQTCTKDEDDVSEDCQSIHSTD